MQAPAPDLTPHHESTPPCDDMRRDVDGDVRTDAAKLEQLADRVSAARSVY